MNKYIWLLLSLLIGCSSSSDVAITQTGNPPKVSLAVSAFKDTLNDTVAQRSLLWRSSEDPHDTITDVTITSAVVIVEEFELFSDDDLLEFDADRPYVIDLALDSGTIVLDTVDAENGQILDSSFMYITDLTKELDEGLYDSLIEMQDYSMLIKGFVNGDSASTFEFPFYESVDLVVPLSKRIIIGDTGMQRILLVLNVQKWFVDESEGYLNPFVAEDRDDIEESILESIYGEEDEHWEEDDEEEEDDEYPKEEYR